MLSYDVVNLQPSSLNMVKLTEVPSAVGPFHLMYPHPPWTRISEGFEKSVSEGLCASASFDLCVFSEG